VGFTALGLTELKAGAKCIFALDSRDQSGVFDELLLGLAEVL
jgi:hypothetical protein